jgi:hypothetical protein
MSKQDYLTEDPNIPDQKFVCLSFLVPSKEDQTKLSGIKVRGSFATIEEANAYAKRLRDNDPYFDVFVGEVGKWCPFNPDPSSKMVQNAEYAENELNDIMSNYMQNQERAKLFHEQRKAELTKKNLEDNIKLRKENLKTTCDELSSTDDQDKKISLERSIELIEKQIKEMEDKVKEKTKEIDRTNKILKKQSTNTNTSNSINV